VDKKRETSPTSRNDPTLVDKKRFRNKMTWRKKETWGMRRQMFVGGKQGRREHTQNKRLLPLMDFEKHRRWGDDFHHAGEGGGKLERAGKKGREFDPQSHQKSRPSCEKKKVALPINTGTRMPMAPTTLRTWGKKKGSPWRPMEGGVSQGRKLGEKAPQITSLRRGLLFIGRKGKKKKKTFPTQWGENGSLY